MKTVHCQILFILKGICCGALVHAESNRNRWKKDTEISSIRQKQCVKIETVGHHIYVYMYVCINIKLVHSHLIILDEALLEKHFGKISF